MTKINFLNRAEKFMSECYILNSLVIDIKKIQVIYRGSSEKKNSGKDVKKIEASFTKANQKMNSLKTKLQKD